MSYECAVKIRNSENIKYLEGYQKYDYENYDYPQFPVYNCPEKPHQNILYVGDINLYAGDISVIFSLYSHTHPTEPSSHILF